MEHDTVLHFSKGDHPIYNPQFKQLTPDNTYPQTDELGKYYLKPLIRHVSRPSLQFEWEGFMPPPGESWIYPKERLDELNKAGKISYRSQGQRPSLKVYLEERLIEVGSIWDDIFSISPLSQENLNFQNQKPLFLLNRLINMGSNPGDLILDPFCGTGTSLIAAQLNGRRWLGCDISSEAYFIAIQRIEKQLELRKNVDFSIGDQDLLEQKFPVILAYIMKRSEI